MRAKEFLLEYSRDKTAEMVGDKLITALAKDRRPPMNLIDIRDSAAMGPSWYNADPDRMKSWTNTILGTIENLDPTPNKAYTPWLARMYAKGGLKMEDINRSNFIGLYDLAKKRRIIKPEHNDINSFKTYTDFELAIILVYNRLQDADAPPNDKGKAKKVYDDGNVTVIIPEDEAAACRYGRGTRWCTASTKGENYFNMYNKEGPLYILNPKNPTHEGEKYQLHFPSTQFMNEDDEAMSLGFILGERFPELLEFFQKTEPEYIKDRMIFMPDEELQSMIDTVYNLALPKAEKVFNDWKKYDEGWAALVKKFPNGKGGVDWIDWDAAGLNDDGYEQREWDQKNAKSIRIAMNFMSNIKWAIRPTAKELKDWIIEKTQYEEFDPEENNEQIGQLVDVLRERIAEIDDPGSNTYLGDQCRRDILNGIQVVKWKNLGYKVSKLNRLGNYEPVR